MDSDDDLGFFVGLRNAVLMLVIGAAVVVAFVWFFKVSAAPQKAPAEGDKPQPSGVVPAAVAAPQACIAQYGPGERWVSSLHVPLTCASAAGVVPDHIMTEPVRSQ